MSAWDVILIAAVVSTFGVAAMRLTEWVGQFYGFTIRAGRFHWYWGRYSCTFHAIRAGNRGTGVGNLWP